MQSPFLPSFLPFSFLPFLPLESEAAGLVSAGGLRGRGRGTSLGGVKADANRFFKDFREALLRQRGALEVLGGADRLGARGALLGRDRLLAALLERGDGRLFFAQIELGADQNDGRAVGVLLHLGIPLCSDRVEARGRKQTKTQEKNICSWIRQRSQRVELVRAGSIPQAEIHRLGLNNRIRVVIIKHCRHVFARERIGRVRNQHARFACVVGWF
jgi:hypothetical protein